MFGACVVVASALAVNNPKDARQLGHASLGVSVGGITVSIIIVVVVFSLAVGGSGGQ